MLTYCEELTGLDPTKKYYFKAYAINEAGTGEGEWKSFGVDVIIPEVDTNDATGVTHEKAVLNGNITDTGGQECKERGFEYKIGEESTILTIRETGEFGIGAYSLDFDGLDPNLTYHFRAYAKNDAGTGHGDWLDFNTGYTTPMVVTHNATNELTTKVTGNGEIVSTGGMDCAERGFEYGLSKVATWVKKETAGGYGVGHFNLTIDGLSANTEYWYRAYAKFFKGHIISTLNVDCSIFQDIYIQNEAVYATAHNALEGTITTGYVLTGQNYDINGYNIRRGFITFDTSGLPDTALIESATLKLKIKGDYSDTDFDLIIRNGQPTYPHIPLVVGDYLHSHYSGNGGSKNTGDAPDGDGTWFYINLNATGLSWINKTGITKLALISSRDVAEEPPTGDEGFTFEDPTAFKSILTITYYASWVTYTGYGEWLKFITAAPGAPGDKPSGYKNDVCSDDSGFTYILNRSLTDDGATYESFFVLSTDLSGKKTLHTNKRLLDIFSYFDNKGMGTAKVYVKRNNEPVWQEAGEISLTGEEETIIKHLPVDFLAKNYLIKFVFWNDFEFIGTITEAIPIGDRP
ncbi:hypothetical protein ES708_15412 [subsurface metagenome]